MAAQTNGCAPAPMRFGCHSKPLRGLLSTPQSVSFEGRFGRIFPHCLPAPMYGATEEDSRKALRLLADAMVPADRDDPKDGADSEESAVPALYTYFGQFVDHDMTFDPVTSLESHFDPNALIDFRTPALDLDNLYGRGPSDQPYLYDFSEKGQGTKFLLGKAINPKQQDLQRNSQGRALIGDPRNDENSIISQFHAVMLQFHNAVVDKHSWLNSAQGFPELQKIVRWHYQWVVVHDFLERIIQPDVLGSLKTGGKYDKGKIKFYSWKNNPFIPVEYSVAAYRLGHSMVRPGYRLNDQKLLQIFPNPEDSESLGLTGFRAMEEDRGIDWGRFIDIDLRPYGPLEGQAQKAQDQSEKNTVEAEKNIVELEKNTVQGEKDKVQTENDKAQGEKDKVQTGNDKAQEENDERERQRRLQFAYRIDTSIVKPLQSLPTSVASDAPASLAHRNLLRSFVLGLPTGQAVARAMGETVLKPEEIVLGKAEDDTKLNSVADMEGLDVFKTKTPLWTYILAEAAQYKVKSPIAVAPSKNPKSPTEVTSPKLGKVGGRIVAETILGLLFADKSSFLFADPNWQPTIKERARAGTEKEPFQLRDLVAYAIGTSRPMSNA